MTEQYTPMTQQSETYVANKMVLDQAETMPSDAQGEERQINSRFGTITVKTNNPIIFPKGILGMPDKNAFCLTNFPVAKFSQFKLLQSLEDDELAFITMPLEIENPIIDKDDVYNGCKDLGFSPDHTALLLIVSVHRELKKIRLSANARAPLFMDAPRRVAEQYVLHNNKYVVRHMITG